MPEQSPQPEVSPASRVSIVMVSRNAEDPLRQCLAALELARAHGEFEAVLVDLGSSDASASMDHDFPWLMEQRMPRNFGLTRARNIGIRTTTREFLLFLDPRVALEPQAIKLMAASLSGDSAVGAVVPELRTPQGSVVPQAYHLPDSAALRQACRTGSGLPPIPLGSVPNQGVFPCALMVRKQFVTGMNYLDEKRFSWFWADVELCWQLHHAGKSIVQVTGASGVLQLDAAPLPSDASAKALLAADAVAGASAYVSKHEGMLAGVGFRTAFILSSLFGFKTRLLTALLSGQRIDGTQGGTLG